VDRFIIIFFFLACSFGLKTLFSKCIGAVNLIVKYLARVIVESAHLVATKAALYQVRVRRVRVDSILD